MAAWHNTAAKRHIVKQRFRLCMELVRVGTVGAGEIRGNLGCHVQSEASYALMYIQEQACCWTRGPTSLGAMDHGNALMYMLELACC